MARRVNEYLTSGCLWTDDFTNRVPCSHCDTVAFNTFFLQILCSIFAVRAGRQAGRGGLGWLGWGGVGCGGVGVMGWVGWSKVGQVEPRLSPV